MDRTFCNNLSWGFFIANTWTILILLEALIWRQVYVNLFLLIFSIVFYRKYKKLAEQKQNYSSS
ncbi:MAG: hypothetical protein ACEQSA_05355 [Weeksellaceae bacterium]